MTMKKGVLMATRLRNTEEKRKGLIDKRLSEKNRETGFCSLVRLLPSPYKVVKTMTQSDFDEWKAINASEIEELADYFMAHDSEGYFTGDKYKEAYEKIESLCRMAYERRWNSETDNLHQRKNHG